MRQNNINLAVKKFKEISKFYKGFVNVIFDNWRGFRFIYDTKDVRICRNKCNQCLLFKLVKNEKKYKSFSAGLILAARADRKIFGKQKYLNCKTIKQYQNCYVNFLVKMAKSEKEIIRELNLIRNLKIIYSKAGRKEELENNFRRSIILKSLKLAKARKRLIIASLALKTGLI